MLNVTKSYLTIVAASLIVAAASSDARAQKIFYDPDTVFITTGVNTEFDLELKVDTDVTSLRAYAFYVEFDATKFDTVSITEGPLLPSSGAMTIFHKYVVTGDSGLVLQVEGLIMGAGIDVSGPGVLATVRLKAVDTGTADLSVLYHGLRDVYNNPVESEASGASVFIDHPPASFNLLDPTGGETVTRYSGEDFDLVWSSSRSVYPGESILYTLEYGTSPVFTPGETTTLSGLSDTSYTLFADDLDQDTYYWRVKATGDLHGFERSSTPLSESFEFVSSCCIGEVGNVNMGEEELPDIGDMQALIDHLFIGMLPLPCIPEADIDQSGGSNPDPEDVDIGDMQELIDHLFIGMGSFPPCL